MRISVDVNGYYDWVPVPPGTTITKEDVSSLKVKKMADDKWNMKVTVKCPDKPTHHDVGLHEEQICQRMAALEKVGKPETREQVITFMLKESFRHHIAPSHMIKINVHDDGPIKEVYEKALEEAGVTDTADTLATYCETTDMETYLNMYFKTASTKKGKK